MNATIAPGYSLNYTLDLNPGSVTQGKNTPMHLCHTYVFVLIREFSLTSDYL